MIDFHSHVLPYMDDGADCVETSLKMMVESKKQGVTEIVATPHFYREQMTVDAFLERRQRSYHSLMAAAEGKELPKIHLGCEVAMDSELHRMDGLEKLCLNDGGVILLEMPYEPCRPWLNDSVYHILAKRKLTPVIAHADRYSSMLKQFHRMETLLSMEVAVQLNAEAFLDWRMNRFMKKIIDLGCPLVLGSDMHNMEERKTRIGKATRKIEKRFGAEFLDDMERNAFMLLHQRQEALF